MVSSFSPASSSKGSSSPCEKAEFMNTNLLTVTSSVPAFKILRGDSVTCPTKVSVKFTAPGINANPLPAPNLSAVTVMIVLGLTASFDSMTMYAVAESSVSRLSLAFTSIFTLPAGSIDPCLEPIASQSAFSTDTVKFNTPSPKFDRVRFWVFFSSCINPKCIELGLASRIGVVLTSASKGITNLGSFLALLSTTRLA